MPSRLAGRFAAGLLGSALAVAVLLVAAPGPAAAEPLFGFNEDWLAEGHAIAASDRFRPTTQRLVLDWSTIEPVAGRYRWAAVDGIYRGMESQGASPIALVVGAPCWAAATPVCSDGRLRAVSPGHFADWERFVRDVVQRFPRLAALEVWNEPNFAFFYSPLPDVASYVKTLERAHAASKSVRPRLPVLGGSLAPLTTRARVRRDGGFARQPPAKYPYALFLDRIYRLGAARHMDGLAFHPYPNFAPYLDRRARRAGVRRGGLRRGYPHGIRADIHKQIRTVRRIQRRHRAPAPIWATETGICTTGTRERRASRREQAVGLKAAYVTLARLRVKAIILHRLWDVRVPGTPAENIENGCGLTEINGRRKPAWRTLLRLRTAAAAGSRRRGARRAAS